MQRIKWVSLILVLLITACQEEESRNVIPQEQVSVAPSSNLRASTLVEEGNLTGWFDQVTFFEGDNGTSNIHLEGKVKHEGVSQPFIYSILYQNIEGVWEKIFTTDLFPTQPEDGNSGFAYTLALPENMKTVIDAGGGYKLATFVHSRHGQGDKLALKTFYAGNRKVHNLEAQSLPTTRTHSSGLKSSVDFVGGDGDAQTFTIAGWVCRCGDNDNIDVSNNNYVYATLSDRRAVNSSPDFRANLASEQAIKDICKTDGLDHRFNGTFFYPLSNDVRVDIFVEERDFFAPGNITLLESQFCLYDNFDDIWVCSPLDD